MNVNDTRRERARKQVLGGIPYRPKQLREKSHEQQYKEARTAQLQHEHWLMYVCPHCGATFEAHRSVRGPDPDPEAPMPAVNCPRCHRDATYETHEQTATREYADLIAPARVLAQLSDRITEWAMSRLNATRWTQQSDLAREQRAKAERGTSVIGGDSLLQRMKR